ncbi:hypothetical protein GCM10009801_59400 [Streptomyces albiaxialis]|uniref:Uncharacterized protein n=1 Tax=Streptomyces albiaxialis TaxID=329523 RepID=A0ABN2WHR2_9ACTN
MSASTQLAAALSDLRTEEAEAEGFSVPRCDGHLTAVEHGT